MDRVRARIGDKRVLTLVKAFLKACILTEVGTSKETVTGTPQGGILSPLLADHGSAHRAPRPAARQGRQKDGRSPDPTAATVDSQSVRAAANIPCSTSGWDGG
nr:hypothetical protein [Streptomyces canus]